MKNITNPVARIKASLAGSLILGTVLLLLTPAQPGVMSADEQNLFNVANDDRWHDKVQALLAKGVSPNVLSFESKAAMHAAAEGGAMKNLTVMLQAGGDPNLLDGEGNTPLHWASAGSGGITVNYPAARMTPGTTFRDCEECPEMVAIPTGSYQMGDVSDGVYSKELPVHEVMISRPFAVGKYEVTFAEWDACRAADGCTHQPNDMFWGRGTRPVINVSWEDAQEYVKWLSHKTGKPYRLLSKAEWEYVARAGTTTKYWWGNEIGTNNANCLDCGSQGDMEGTAPVGSFAANGFGVFDTAGNVWEWVEDCWNDNYEGAPTDGQAWMNENCHRRVVRGGSWVNFPEYVRPADRIRLDPGLRNSSYGGFRIARTLTP